MKRKCFYLSTLCCVLGVLGFLACQDVVSEKSTPEAIEQKDPNLKIARKNLDDFMKFIKPNTKGAANEITITDVVKRRLPLTLKDSLITPLTKSALAEMKDSADLYTFIFTQEENKGYAIVSGEEKVAKTYAYVEKGNLADTIKNYGLCQALRMVDEIFQDDVLGTYVAETKGQDAGIAPYAEYQKSLTRLEWGQGRPYNNNAPVTCPITDQNPTGHAPAGCVTIAIGMVVAAGESIFAVREDQVNLYNKVPRILNSTPEAAWAANFVSKIGTLLEVNYGCEGSSATTDGASRALSHYWMIHQVENGFNDNWTKHSLDEGRPIIAFGATKNEAHCWLLDGGVKDANGNYTHFYNNWGDDGWDNGIFAIADYTRYTSYTGEVYNYNRNNKFIYIFDYPKQQ